MEGKLVRDTAGNVIGVCVPHPDGHDYMAPLVPVPETATVETDEQHEEA